MPGAIGVLLTASIGLWGPTILGQSPDPGAVRPITSFELRVYAPGQDPAVDLPFRRFTFPASAVECGQPPAIDGAIPINPTKLQWQDPGDVAKTCVADIGALLRGLPAAAGPYLATLTAMNEWGASDPSPPSNIFFRTQF
jgi:hypothetical protein